MNAASFNIRVPAARPVALKRPLRGLVCGKCVKRAGGDGKKAAKHLTRAIRAAEGGKAQARDVGCLKLCPRGRVMVLDAAGQAWLTPAESWLAEAVALLARPAPATPVTPVAVDPDDGSDAG